MLSHLDLLDESHTKIRNALGSPEFSGSSGNLFASCHHGQLKNSTPATSSATTMGKRWPTSISRKSQGGDASEKRYQKAFPKINALSMTS